MVKLTEKQRFILLRVSNNTGAAFEANTLGRATCEALRKRGLVDAGGIPISRWGLNSNPYIYITPAGRAALSEAQT